MPFNMGSSSGTPNFHSALKSLICSEDVRYKGSCVIDSSSNYYGVAGEATSLKQLSVIST